MGENPLVELRDCSIIFPGVKALDGVNFKLYPGECHALVGENGAGKSTLCKIICGVYSHYQGELYFCGRRIVFRSPLHAQRMGVSAVHQELQLVPELSVLENVFLGKFVRSKSGMIDWRTMETKANQIFQFLQVKIDLKVPVKRLRTAEKQIVQLARALNQNARVIILDELTAVLQEKEIENIFRIIRTLKQKGLGIIYVSHRLNEVFQLCDTYTVLCDGRLVKTGRVCEISREEMIRMMVGRDLKKVFPDLNPNIGKIRLEVRDLSSKAFSNINLSVRAGEVVGIAGLVGAGKTEFLHALFGNLRLQKGKILIDGEEVFIDNPLKAVRRKIALVPDERRTLGLVLDFPVWKNVTLPSMKFFKRARLFMNQKAEREASKKLVRSLRIACSSLEQSVRNLSGGNQQKVVFAKWLLTDVDILLLDEPTRGIDVGAKAEIYQIISELSRKGKAVILVSPELEELMGLCHKIYVMFEGKIKAVISGAEKRQEVLIRYMVGEQRGDLYEKSFVAETF